MTKEEILNRHTGEMSTWLKGGKIEAGILQAMQAYADEQSHAVRQTLLARDQEIIDLNLKLNEGKIGGLTAG